MLNGNEQFWIKRYIRRNCAQFNRYEIDLHLLRSGYTAAEIDCAWKDLLSVPEPITLRKRLYALKSGIMLVGNHIRQLGIVWRILAFVVILTLALVILIVTGVLFPDGPELRRQLTEAQRKWQAKGVSSYTIVMRESNVMVGGCQVSTTIIDGLKTGRRSFDSVEGHCYYISNGLTIPDLFDTIDTILKDTAKLNNLKGLIYITYDSTYGFPTRITANYCVLCLEKSYP